MYLSIYIYIYIKKQVFAEAKSSWRTDFWEAGKDFAQFVVDFPSDPVQPRIQYKKHIESPELSTCSVLGSMDDMC